MMIVGTLLFFADASIGDPLPEVHDEGDLPASALARPVLVYPRSATAPCFADYVPCASEFNREWRIAMAGDEYEPMQIGLYVPRGKPALGDVTLEVDCDLSHKIGRIYHQLDACRSRKCYPRPCRGFGCARKLNR